MSIYASHFYYLANPYRGTPEEVRERVFAVQRVCAALIKNGVPTYSPIVHNHALVQAVPFTQEEINTVFLEAFDLKILPASKGMILLKLPGWDRSYGVQKELEVCEALGIPVFSYLFEELLEHPPSLEDLASLVECCAVNSFESI